MAKATQKIPMGLPAKTKVKAGYKQTELGVIPEDWDVKNLDDIFKFKQGVQCPIEKQKFHNGHELKRFLRIIDLTQPSELPRYINDHGSDYHISKDDLFMVRYGNPGLLGYGYEGVIANNLLPIWISSYPNGNTLEKNSIVQPSGMLNGVIEPPVFEKAC